MYIKKKKRDLKLLISSKSNTIPCGERRDQQIHMKRISESLRSVKTVIFPVGAVEWNETNVLVNSMNFWVEKFFFKYVCKNRNHYIQNA